MAQIIFFGNERIATGVTTTVPTLQALITAGHTVLAVVVAQEIGAKSRSNRELEIIGVAAAHNINIYSPSKLSEIKDDLAALQPDIGVLVAYGKLVPQSVIDIFPHGIINIHPSLLPAHRGSIPLEAAMLAGDAQTGVSLMQLVREMDAGPTYAQAAVELGGTETKQQLADTLLKMGGEMLLQVLPSVLDGSLVPTPQPTGEVLYDPRLEKTAGLIDANGWNRPAVEIERMVRALAGWPRVRTTLGNYDIIITKARIAVPTEDDSYPEAAAGTIFNDGKTLGVHTGDNLLIIDSLIPAGKKEMSAQAFLAGYSL